MHFIIEKATLEERDRIFLYLTKLERTEYVIRLSSVCACARVHKNEESASAISAAIIRKYCLHCSDMFYDRYTETYK